jgi:hypothetical protein
MGNDPVEMPLSVHIEEHKHKINAHTEIHALSGIRTHDPSFRGGEYSLCLRPRGRCDRHSARNALRYFSFN